MDEKKYLYIFIVVVILLGAVFIYLHHYVGDYSTPKNLWQTFFKSAGEADLTIIRDCGLSREVSENIKNLGDERCREVFLLYDQIYKNAYNEYSSLQDEYYKIVRACWFKYTALSANEKREIKDANRYVSKLATDSLAIVKKEMVVKDTENVYYNLGAKVLDLGKKKFWSLSSDEQRNITNNMTYERYYFRAGVASLTVSERNKYITIGKKLLSVEDQAKVSAIPYSELSMLPNGSYEVSSSVMNREGEKLFKERIKKQFSGSHFEITSIERKKSKSGGLLKGTDTYITVNVMNPSPLPYSIFYNTKKWITAKSDVPLRVNPNTDEYYWVRGRYNYYRDDYDYYQQPNIIRRLGSEVEIVPISEYTDDKKVKWCKVRTGDDEGWVLFSHLKEKTVTSETYSARCSRDKGKWKFVDLNLKSAR